MKWIEAAGFPLAGTYRTPDAEHLLLVGLAGADVAAPQDALGRLGDAVWLTRGANRACDSETAPATAPAPATE